MLTMRASPTCWGTHPDWSSLNHYNKNGYQERTDFFKPSDIRMAQTQAMILRHDYKGDGVIHENDGNTVRSIFGIYDVQHQIEDLICTDKLIGLAREILDSEVYIHQFHINYKAAYKGGGFFWHSDYTYWHWEDGMPQPRAVSMVVPLESMTYENGPLFVHTGSHRYIGHDTFYRTTMADHDTDIKHDEHDLGGATRDQLNMLRDDKSSSAMHAILGEPGSLTIMDANLLHMSMPNWSPYHRMCAFVCFNSMENQLGKPPSNRPHRPQYITNRIPRPL